MFSDYTSAAGLDFTHQTLLRPVQMSERHLMTPGVGIADFNRDGLLDVFVAGGLGQNSRLFINLGNCTFADQTEEWNIDMVAVEGSSVTIGDVDADGDLDLYVGSLDGRSHFFLNEGSHFEEYGITSGAVFVDGQSFDTFGATFGDVELDGDLDLVTADWFVGSDPKGNQLFLNNGQGVFTRATEKSGLNTENDLLWGFTPALVDLNDDRYPELTFAADFGTSQYYVNAGNGQFSQLFGNGTCIEENGMGSAFVDYDNDGDLDWFVTSIFDDDGVPEKNWGVSGNRLYRNDGSHQFTDVTDVAGVRNGHWGWGASFGDFDHDGLLDLAMTNGFIDPFGGNPDPTFVDDPSRLWMNTGDFIDGPTYVEVATSSGFVHTDAGKGLVTFDAENDGDLDILLTTNRGSLAFFRNNTNPDPHSWIQLEFISPPGNAPDGIGAAVRLNVGGSTYHRIIHSAASFMSHEPLRQHFGFPEQDTIDHIVVTWPDGSRTAMTNVPSGQVFTFMTGDANGDGQQDVDDLVHVILNWGPCSQGPCDGDSNDDGIVNIDDLILVIRAWAP